MWLENKRGIFYILNNVKIIKIIRKDVWVSIILSGKRFSQIEILNSDNLEVLKLQSLLKAKDMGWEVESTCLK